MEIMYKEKLRDSDLVRKYIFEILAEQYRRTRLGRNLIQLQFWRKYDILQLRMNILDS